MSGLAFNSQASTTNMVSNSTNIDYYSNDVESKIQLLEKDKPKPCIIEFKIKGASGSVVKGQIVDPDCKEAASTIVKIASLVN